MPRNRSASLGTDVVRRHPAREGSHMDGAVLHPPTQARLARMTRGAVTVDLAVACSAWVGWTAGIELMTRILPDWPVMTPWAVLFLVALGTAVLLQAGDPSRGRVRVGRAL